MNVAMIGLGKLGSVVSCAMTQRGHTVYGYDIDPDLRTRLRSGDCPYYEPDADGMLQDALANGLYVCDTVKAAIKSSEIIFIAVPTPSNSDHSFDTSYVESVLTDIAPYIGPGLPYRVVSIISTVLPGTCRSVFLPTLETGVGFPPGSDYGFAYNAQFIAMGTVVEDFLRPEFVLVGEYDRRSGDVLAAFYTQVVNAPVLRMSIESAETTKMAYNCYVGSKLIIANAIMELCHNVPGADCDVVSDALSRSHRRILGPRYMRGGMGDGGNCLLPGEWVMTYQGPRPVEKIRHGDMVLTIDGSYQEVLATWERIYNGKVVQITVAGASTTLTCDHRMVAITDVDLRLASIEFSNRGDSIKSLEVVARELMKGDLLPWPRVRSEDHHCGNPSIAVTYGLQDAFWRPIENLSVRSYEGSVHNLWVDGNHTYVVACGAILNCHGRDNLALSYLSQQLNLSSDPFAFTQQARDDQSHGLARLVSRYANRTRLPIAILGITFKPETNLTDFSPCLLLGEHLQELGLEPCFHDPIVQTDPLPYSPHLFVIAMRHGEYRRYPFPPGSTIIDPWRMLSRPPEGCTYIPIGRPPLEVS